ncbi:hypothetical protein GDO78_014740 [Eleutherodactylus coqui]|uniref:Uncharacterized protein n=1 Tax=Eleutherodactylus coqui TaxID=57060 RepID=A0A8J6EM88_ELECQ|nr:hypothetical protein GDO78_014740 [Eleutherodactylus coqui]
MDSRRFITLSHSPSFIPPVTLIETAIFHVKFTVLSLAGEKEYLRVIGQSLHEPLDDWTVRFRRPARVVRLCAGLYGVREKVVRSGADTGRRRGE